MKSCRRWPLSEVSGYGRLYNDFEVVSVLWKNWNVEVALISTERRTMLFHHYTYALTNVFSGTITIQEKKGE